MLEALRCNGYAIVIISGFAGVRGGAGGVSGEVRGPRREQGQRLARPACARVWVRAGLCAGAGADPVMDKVGG